MARRDADVFGGGGVTVIRYVTLIRTFFAINAASELQYRAHFGLAVVRSLINLLTNGANLALIFSNTSTLAGWSAPELVAVTGVWFVMGGLMRLVIRPSLAKLMEDVRLGTLDYMLVKPASSQLLASIRVIEVWSLTDVVLGSLLIAGALWRLSAHVGLLEALTFGVVLLAGGAMLYSFCLVLTTSTFWIVRADNILVIFGEMFAAGRYPVTIYPGWLRIILTLIVPVAFATTVPVQAVTGQLNPAGAAGTVLLAAFLCFVASQFWRFGLRHYTGASA